MADRIAQGPIPVDEALPIARQICDALEAAHEQGVIHRDLKPANIKLKPDGTVKVLDFGLAKAMQPDASDPSLSQSPTISLTAAATQMGMVIGTAAYMAPEQAKGLPVDKRADIWAFGAVLFEMLTGRRLFEAGDVSEMLASVLIKEPDISGIGTQVPDHIRSVVRQCLVKDPKERLRDIGDVRLALQSRFDVGVPVPAPAAGGRSVGVWSTALLIVGLLLGSLLTRFTPDGLLNPDSAVRETTVFSLPLPVEPHPRGIAKLVDVSPNGRVVAFAGGDQLYVRDLSQREWAALPGTQGGVSPIFSPDGQALAFIAPDGLRRVPVGGGLVEAIGAGDVRFARWWQNDYLAFVLRTSSGISAMPATGGAPELLTTRGTEGPHLPGDLLPDGEAALFTIMDGEDLQIALLSMASGEHRSLFPGSHPRYLPNGHLLFMRNNQLWAVGFDSDSYEVIGAPVPVLEDVLVRTPFTGGQVAVSDTGTLAYIGGQADDRLLSWFDREGTGLVSVGEPGVSFPIALSPDGSMVAFYWDGPLSDRPGIWVLDIARGVQTLLVAEGAEAAAGNPGNPVWSPDGSTLAYNQGVRGRVLTRPVAGPSDDTLVFQAQEGTFAWLKDWSDAAGGMALLLEGESDEGVVIPMTGDQTPIVFDVADDLDNMHFSPDGGWIAYNANHTGQQEVYLVRYPVTGERVQVTGRGAVQPRWRADGQELYYLTLDGYLTSIDIDTDTATGLDLGSPSPLFQTGLNVVSNVHQYAVANDGQRFLIPVQEASQHQLTIVLNWDQELRERVPLR